MVNPNFKTVQTVFIATIGFLALGIAEKGFYIFYDPFYWHSLHQTWKGVEKIDLQHFKNMIKYIVTSELRAFKSPETSE